MASSISYHFHLISASALTCDSNARSTNLSFTKKIPFSQHRPKTVSSPLLSSQIDRSRAWRHSSLSDANKMNFLSRSGSRTGDCSSIQTSFQSQQTEPVLRLLGNQIRARLNSTKCRQTLSFNPSFRLHDLLIRKMRHVCLKGRLIEAKCFTCGTFCCDKYRERLIPKL